MAFSNYQHGFKNGVTIRGVPVELSHPGKVFWVGNNAVRLDNEYTAADGNEGTFLRPYATVMAAYAACAAGRGDVIFVRPGYTETLTPTSWALNKSSVAIIGLGAGSIRPTLTLDSTGDTITVTAPNNAIRNFIMNSTVASLVTVFTTGATATDLSIEECSFTESGSGTILSVVTVGSTSNAADGLYFARNYLKTTGAGTAGAIAVTGTNDRVQVLDNHLVSAQTASAPVVLTAAKQLTNFLMLRNFSKTAATSNVTGTCVQGGTGASSTASTGFISQNLTATLDTSASSAITVHASLTRMVKYRNGAWGTNVVFTTDDAAASAVVFA